MPQRARLRMTDRMTAPWISYPRLLQTQHWTQEEVEALEEYVAQVRGAD